jgi:AhpD family alkylhydroperoxidase
MSSTSSGSLVPLLTEDEFAEVDRPALGAGVAAYGQVLNTWAAIGHSPGLFSTYLPFLKQLNAPGALGLRIKDLTAVRVAVLNQCAYTSSHRCSAALANGVSVEDLGAVAAGDLERFTERERVALALAEEVTVKLATAAAEEAARVFEAAELVELVMCISIWNALSRYHKVMGFELDMPPAPAAVADRL